MNPRDIIYDSETIVNFYLNVMKHPASGTRWIFEISPWNNHAPQLAAMLNDLRARGFRMIGFNNFAFDYPILHDFLHGTVSPQALQAKAQAIINSQGVDGGRWAHEIRQPLIEQVDLYKIHHFDNRAKSTSLKAIEFNRRSHSVETTPFDPLQPITTNEQRETVIRYACHDVEETQAFAEASAEMIRFREELSAKYGRNFMNDNDTKIGKQYFIMRLEEAGIPTRSGGQPRQTPRDRIPLAPLIFPYIGFQREEFSRVLNYLKTVTLTDTNAAPELKGVKATLRGFDYHFGTGGIHGSMESTRVYADENHIIRDVDVKSFYPNIAIVNRVFPEHLSVTFCDIYQSLYEQRQQTKKGDAENGMLKLALNGVYGDSNNDFSPFRDPSYTMTITINGQLLICMLAEHLSAMLGIEVVQVNTDGLTVRMHKDCVWHFEQCCRLWQERTRLELEFSDYSAMFIRDVNNYVAVGTDGKVKKRKGAYQWKTDKPWDISQSLGWHQDWGGLVIPQAAEATMLRGVTVADFINTHSDPWDFMLRAKVSRGSRLVAAWGSFGDIEQQPLTRYHIANEGPHLVKIMSPLAKAVAAGKTDDRRIGIDAGWKVNICNRAADFSWANLNRAYYIEAAQKLVIN